MALRPYEEIAPEPLAFPIKGKVYVVAPVGYLTGMRLQDLVSGKITAQDFGKDEDLWKMLLGDTFEKMKTDNVPLDAIARAGFAVLTDYKFGRGAAEAVWESGFDPKVIAQKVSETLGLPTPKPPASTRSRSTASGSRTQKRASTRSTTSRKK